MSYIVYNINVSVTNYPLKSETQVLKWDSG